MAARSILAKKKLETFLKSLAFTGEKINSADAAGIPWSTLEKRIARDPGLRGRVDEAMSRFHERIESTVRGRGIEGWEEPVFWQGEVVGHVRKYSDRCLEMLAKRHIAEYRDKMRIDASVQGGVLVVGGMMDEDEWVETYGGKQADEDEGSQE
jgi:hypothetical protein